MNKKAKIVKVIKKLAISSLIAVTAISTGAKIYAEVKYSDYSNDTQVKAIAQALDCTLDANYNINKNYTKFLHNDDEPIYVTVDSNLDKYKSFITQSLDYMFNTIGSINENYKYEIVSEIPEGKSSITFKEKNLDYQNIAGFVSFKMPIETVLLNKTLLSQANISIDLNKLKDLNDEQLLYVFVHELVHVFGIKDVYTDGDMKSTNCHKGYSCINVKIGEKIVKLSPNDIRVMLSLYSKKANSKKELNETIEKCKTYAEKYDEKYYNHYTKKIKELVQNIHPNSINFTEFNDDFLFSSQTSASYNNQSYTTKYQIEYSDDSYTLKIFDENDKLLEHCTGDVVIKNDVMVLKDVTLNHGLRPNDLFNKVPDGYVQDLTLYKNNKTVCFYDIYENQVMYGKTTILENDLTL